MDNLVLTNICDIIFNSLSSLLLFIFLQWLTTSLFYRVSSRTVTGTAGAGDQVLEKQGYAGDARGSRCLWPVLLFSHTLSLSSGTTFFFVSHCHLPRRSISGVSLTQSLSLHPSAPTKQLIAFILWFLFRSLSINI